MCTQEEKKSRHLCHVTPDMTRILIFFLFLDESIYCWYSLEASQQGTFMSYATCFHGEISSLSRALRKANKQNVEAAGRKYHNNPKYWDTLLTYHTSPKIWNSPFYYLSMCLKYYCMYGKQCRPGRHVLWHLIWVYTVCKGLPVPVLRIVTVLQSLLLLDYLSISAFVHYLCIFGHLNSEHLYTSPCPDPLHTFGRAFLSSYRSCFLFILPREQEPIPHT